MPTSSGCCSARQRRPSLRWSRSRSATWASSPRARPRPHPTRAPRATRPPHACATALPRACATAARRHCCAPPAALAASLSPALAPTPLAHSKAALKETKANLEKKDMRIISVRKEERLV
eukprot:2531133-Prymnesium_polylepis.1